MADALKADFVVIGAGIAGASVAAELAQRASVILLEAESRPGVHATGRSAAYFAPAYGNDVVRAITAESELFFRQPPAGFTETPLLAPRPALFIGFPSQAGSIRNLQAEDQRLLLVDETEIRRRVPILRSGNDIVGLLDERGGDLDVDAILQGYLKSFRRRGGTLVTGAQVSALSRVNDVWRAGCGNEAVIAPVVVNAAGAWADRLGELANIGRVGLAPKRRTALLIDPPAGVDCSRWPLVVDVDEHYYFKPDAGKLLLSPADETPSEPCDAQPEDLDVAIAIDRFMKVTSMPVGRVTHRWAGLRTFAADSSFVAGFDPRSRGFFWLAGQGGYGVQTAPGLSRMAAALATGEDAPAPLASLVQAVAPDRLIS